MLNTFTEKISGNVKEKFNFDRNLRSGLRSWKTGCKTFRQQLTKNTRSDSQQKKNWQADYSVLLGSSCQQENTANYDHER